MGTPLARRLKPTRSQLAHHPQQFEPHQVLRLMHRASPDREPKASVAAYSTGAAKVIEVTLPTRRKPAEVVLDPATLPPNCESDDAAEAVNFLHEQWEIAHPFAVAERGGPEAQSFARDAHAFSGVPLDRDLPAEFQAFAAGCLRRGGSPALASACEEFFDVPVRFESLGGGRGRLRVGPLGFAEYLELLPNEGGAWKALLAWASLFLGAAVELEIVLVLKGDEVPACVPGTPGASVGIAAWPQCPGAVADVEMTFAPDDEEAAP